MSIAYPVSLMPSDPGDLMANIYADCLAMSVLQNHVYATTATIGLISGICGRAFNTHTGAGLNQYILGVGGTGTGKDSIAYCTSRLFDALALRNGGNVGRDQSFNDFRGPGELVSSAGLIKWLDKKPATYCILGEIGLLMQQMTKPNAAPNYASLQRVLLQFYSKSGNGNSFDPSAYSDKEKNTGLIKSPSLTIVGETTGSTFYGGITEAQIHSGLIPRFLFLENTAPRPPKNTRLLNQPNDFTIEALERVAAQALNLAHRGAVQYVQIATDAMRLSDDFGHHATVSINSGDEVERQLWNRAELKVLKLSALPAISRNCLNPQIILSDVQWATDLVNHQTVDLIGKFARNEVGVVDGDEGKQRAAVIRIIFEHNSEPFEKFKTYQCNEDMHRKAVITHSYLSRRLSPLPAFKNDRQGATAALKRTLQRFLDDDELREVPTMQMSMEYGTKAKAYIVSNAKTFGVEPVKGKLSTGGTQFFK